MQASRQRSTPRLPGPSGYPRCGRPAGPAAKLAARCAVVVGQRDRTSPGEPPSLGGSEGMERRRAWWCESKCTAAPLLHSLDIFLLCQYAVMEFADGISRLVGQFGCHWEKKAVPLFTIRLLPDECRPSPRNVQIQMDSLPPARPKLYGTRRGYGDKPVAR